MAKGVSSSLTEKQFFVIQQFPAGLCQYYVVFQSKELYYVGVAVQEQPDNFVKRINDCICLIVRKLLKTCEPQQIRGPVQGDAAYVNIAPLAVGPVPVASAYPQKYDPVSEMRIRSEKAIFFCLYQCLKVHKGLLSPSGLHRR